MNARAQAAESLLEKLRSFDFVFDDQDFHGKPQNSNRSANCISRGVPDPTGVMGETMLVFTVFRMLPKLVVFEGLKVDCG